MNKGFTLLETLITITVLGIIATAGLWMSFSFYATYVLSAERDTFVTLLYRARDEAVIKDSDYGVSINGPSYSVFTGINFDSTDPLNENYEKNQAVSISGQTAIFFNEAGEPTPAQSTFVFSYQNYQKQVTVNNDGSVIY